MTRRGEQAAAATSKGDRKQIGLPRSLFPLLEALEASPWFRLQQDAYKVSIAVALARGFTPSVHGTESFETKFSVSGVDPDGSLRDLILALVPEEAADRPYDYAQRLAVAGVQYLHSELVDKDRPLSEVLGLGEGEDEGHDEV